MISKFKAFRIRFTVFLGSYRGKSIFNLFYGLGAAVAILGTLFKLLHLDGANMMLAVGLGTEVFLFAISALEPPYRNYHWENVFPVLKTNSEQDRPDFQNLPGGVSSNNMTAEVYVGDHVAPGEPTVNTGRNRGSQSGGGTIIIGNMPPSGGSYVGGAPSDKDAPAEGVVASGGVVYTGGGYSGGGYSGGGSFSGGSGFSGGGNAGGSSYPSEGVPSDGNDPSGGNAAGRSYPSGRNYPSGKQIPSGGGTYVSGETPTGEHFSTGEQTPAGTAIPYTPHPNPMAGVTPQQARENYGIPPQVPISDEDAATLTDSIRKMGEAVSQLNNLADITMVTENYISKLSGMAENLNRFSDATGSLAEVSNVLLESYRNVTENSDEISANSKGYVEQMGNLNRNLSGLNTIYEIQLKSVSSQIDTIDRVNKGLVHIREMYENSTSDSERFSKETESMADNLAKLNRVYARMLEAMSPNAIFANMMGGMNAAHTPDLPVNTEEPVKSDETDGKEA